MEVSDTKRKRKKPNGDYGYDPLMNGIDPNNLDPSVLELNFPPGMVKILVNLKVL